MISSLNRSHLQRLLKELGQEQLLEIIDGLKEKLQNSLVEQLRSIHPALLQQQRQILLDPETPCQQGFVPLDTYRLKSDLHCWEKGIERLRQGKVGALLVAGGQGSRLGIDGPKGSVPVSPALHKTLFQYFLERLRAASQRVEFPLQMGIMTSPLNHQETLSFLQSHHYFGCSPDQVTLFTQGSLPFLTSHGDLMLEPSGRILFGADGNAGVIYALRDSGLGRTWKNQGIEDLMFTMIDNPLGDPFDPFMIGAHSEANAEVTLKCIERVDVEEQVGLVVQKGHKTTVLEYSEFPQESWKAKNEAGTLRFRLANISNFCFSLNFLLRCAEVQLPLHKALKPTRPGTDEKAWKFERFIFDILPLADSTQTLLYPREECFAPLKNRLGRHSLPEVQKAMTSFDRTTLTNITGKIPPEVCLEIDPMFYYPTEALLRKWREKEIPALPYIEA